MTLTRKREIVHRFMAGDSLMLIQRRYAYAICKGEDHFLELLNSGDLDTEVEQVLRDYMRGKFRLSPKKGKT